MEEKDVGILQYEDGNHYVLLLDGVVIGIFTKNQLRSFRDLLNEKKDWFED